MEGAPGSAWLFHRKFHSELTVPNRGQPVYPTGWPDLIATMLYCIATENCVLPSTPKSMMGARYVVSITITVVCANMRYVYVMVRTADPQRRVALLAQIVEYLLGQPLATLSFRSLAAALGVSTYTLVYQFGSRAELVHEVVRAITTRQNVVVEAVAAETGEIEEHLQNLRDSWNWSLHPRNQQLQRLEFEASMLEAQEPGVDPITPKVFELWHSTGHRALVAMGLSDADASIEARIMTTTIYGLQYDLIVNCDEERTTAAFNRVLDAYRYRILSLKPQLAG